MMSVICATVNVLPTVVSSGTSGETPPVPCSPWHWLQPNRTKSWAPAATAALTGVPAAG